MTFQDIHVDDIASDIYQPSFYLAFYLTYNLTFYLAFYLTYTLTFYVALSDIFLT